MQRRTFLWTPAIVAAAPKGCDEMDEGMQPWLLWGSQKQLELTITTGPFASPAVSDQLAKVAYHRPDTWAFLLTAETIGVGPTDNPISGTSFDLTVAFNVIAGIGRTKFQTQDHRGVSFSVFNHESFAKLRFAFAPGDRIIGKKKWTTVGQTPLLDDLAVTPERERIEYLPAQDIQCFATGNGSGIGVPPNRVIVNVGAYFAPLTHVRPDWFAEEAEKFSGGQLGGK